MYQNKKTLEMYLAEYALKAYFVDTIKQKKIRKDIKKFCIEHNAFGIKSHNLLQQYIRIKKIELSNNIVSIILLSLSREKRCFIKKKYQKHETPTRISIELNLSVAQQNLWQKSILIELGNFMLYRLTIKDIFNCNKIINMIEVLTSIIYFYKKYNLKIDKNYFNGLELKRKNYYKLFNIVNRFIDNKNKSTYYFVIATKLDNPNFSNNDLANRCHLSFCIISRYIKKFTMYVRHYVY